MQFYEGFQANLVSRLSYLAIRNSLYKIIYDQIKPAKASNDLTIGEKMILAGFVGGTAAYVTSPLTLVSIRQILDSQTRPEWRRGYKTLQQGLSSVRESGKQMTGSVYNVWRHVLLNITLTGPYDYFNEGFYTRFGDYGFVSPLALMLAALFSSVVTLPFDNIRTRIMNAH